MDVEPVTGDVDGHGHLEQEHEAGVECGQGGQETHGGAPVSQHVQHGPKLAALPQQSGGVAVQGIKESLVYQLLRLYILENKIFFYLRECNTKLQQYSWLA